jgi:Response regulator containing CheY-like receiver and SARP domains
MNEYLKNNNIHGFYCCYAWKKKRKEILQNDKHECQYCKAKGKYTKATSVHHVKPVLKYPELAMEDIYTDNTGKHRQLMSACKACHDKEDNKHRERMPLTVERW